MRKNDHQKYEEHKDQRNVNENEYTPIDKHKWHSNTGLIVGDIIHSGVQEKHVEMKSHKSMCFQR